MKKIFIIISSVFLLFGCTTSRFVTQGYKKKRYKRFTTDSKESLKSGKTVWMVTSYYSTKFNGRKTANGEIYNMFDFTCAHKKLPFGTKLKVTNPENNKSVIVRVNDRGPFVEGRDLDISYAAAKKIGLIKYGFKKLKVEILGKK